MGFAALVGMTCTTGPAPTTAPPPDDATVGEELVVVAEPLDDDQDEPPSDWDDTPYPALAEEGLLGLRVPIYDPSGHALAGLHRALRRAENDQGKARLVFYGASHVASDLFTGRIRRALQARFGDGGPGFVMPVKPWPFYRRDGLSFVGDFRRWESHRIRATSLDVGSYGLYGVAVEAEQSGAWGAVEPAIADPSVPGVKASHYELYYLEQPDGGDLDVLIDGQQVGSISTALPSSTDVATSGPDGFIGAAAYERFDVGDGAHRFEVRVRGNGKVRVFGVAAERDESGVIVDALGINGARARYHLLWEESLYRQHLAHRDPDLVVLAYGTNESGDDDVPIEIYEARERQVIERVRSTVPRASCLLIGPSDYPVRDRRAGTATDRPRTAELIDVQKRMAEEYGCGFFDLVAFMGGPLSMMEWAAHEPAYGARDHLHFTRVGYERLGDVLVGAMLRGYDRR